MEKAVYDFDNYRSEFPIAERCVFMNHAAISPLCMRVVSTVESLFREFSDYGSEYYPRWAKRIEEVRRLFASLIHADSDEIAFMTNTSEGLSVVAAGIDWKEGDGVLIARPDFPANIYPWINLERKGVRVHYFERNEGRFSIKEVDKALIPGTRLLSVSSVDFATGFLCDLEALGEFCRKKGLLFCVDAIQSLGLIPMDVKKYGIHFLASGGHKWLLSAMGCGCLFVSKDVDHLVHPVQVGWKSVVQEEAFFLIQFDLKPDALRFEPGTMNVAGIYALGAALELLMEADVEKVYAHVMALNHLLYEGLKERKVRILTPMGANERSGILSFIPSSDPKSLHIFLTEEMIRVSLRNQMIRLSPHFYNNKDDIERFFQALDRY
ncbi:MAG: aminotransferase class V-fold PLP-dependent enzyme [Desulfobacteraceae bacterium]|jgi:selenocysteine lyase/cysteine desulfurase